MQTDTQLLLKQTLKASKSMKKLYLWRQKKINIQETVFWKYAANLQKNTHAKVRFQ